jgi:hypothetical protein
MPSPPPKKYDVHKLLTVLMAARSPKNSRAAGPPESFGFAFTAKQNY